MSHTQELIFHVAGSCQCSFTPNYIYIYLIIADEESPKSRYSIWQVRVNVLIYLAIYLSITDLNLVVYWSRDEINIKGMNSSYVLLNSSVEEYTSRPEGPQFIILLGGLKIQFGILDSFSSFYRFFLSLIFTILLMVIRTEMDELDFMLTHME